MGKQEFRRMQVDANILDDNLSVCTFALFDTHTSWHSNSSVIYPQVIVGSQTGPYTHRTRRHGREKQATPEWEAAGLLSKGTDIRGLSQVTAKQTRQNFKSLPRGLQSHILSRWSQHHLTPVF